MSYTEASQRDRSKCLVMGLFAHIYIRIVTVGDISKVKLP